MHWETRNTYRILFEELKRILEDLSWGTPKIDLQEIMYEEVVWVHVAQDKV
jgi:hypothetical protein